MAEKNSKSLTTNEIFDLIRKVMLDPTRVAIWFEVLRKPGITAKELMNVILIQKTAMYYHLKLLEEHYIIKIKRSEGLKHYHILLNFFDLYEVDKKELKDKEREFQIFSLLIANSLMQREINQLGMMSDKQFQESKKTPTHKIGMWFCSREKLEMIKQEFSDIWNKIKEVDEKEDTQESIINADFAYYSGLADFT
ncbi:MAG: winged helix-turn-helix domain-containing protein [Candidatus Heimdallarchaeota archaeon]